MTTTVTRADREAAARLLIGDSSRGETVARWIDDGVDVPPPFASTTTDDLRDIAQAFAEHRAASTQALREAAERLCAAVEAFARYGGDPLAMRNRMFVASDALRSALAAETSGRDGGDR